MHRYKGSVTNAADVEKVFEGGDVEGVIISLGGKTKDVGPTMLTDGTTHGVHVSPRRHRRDTYAGTATVIAAMKKYDVKRVAVVTSIGAGDSKDQVRCCVCERRRRANQNETPRRLRSCSRCS